MKKKIENFEKTSEALNFIDELKLKNKKCEGLLNCTPKTIKIVDGNTGKKIDETTYSWQVTYNEDLLKLKAEKP